LNLVLVLLSDEAWPENTSQSQFFPLLIFWILTWGSLGSHGGVRWPGNFEDYIRFLSCHLFGPANHGQTWKGWERSGEKAWLSVEICIWFNPRLHWLD
jgi:hypothetical protein